MREVQAASSLRLAELTADNVAEACRIRVGPGLWIPGEGGPEGFYRKLGFRPTGEEMGGEIVGELRL